MKRYFILVVLILSVSALACSVPTGITPPQQGGSEDLVPGVDLKSYFPLEVGQEYQYDITVTDITGQSPLYYSVEGWPLGTNWTYYASRGLYYLDAPEDGYKLVLSIKETAPKQGELEYPEGVLVEVERDDLGIFSGTKALYWAKASDGLVMEVRVLDFLNSPLGLTTTDGESKRPVFFIDRAGTEISLGQDSPDGLLLVGSVDNVAGYEGQTLLYFERHVDPALDNSDYLSSGFVEKLWFAPNVGLVRLIQEVNGITTMTWELTTPEAAK